MKIKTRHFIITRSKIMKINSGACCQNPFLFVDCVRNFLNIIKYTSRSSESIIAWLIQCQRCYSIRKSFHCWGLVGGWVERVSAANLNLPPKLPQSLDISTHTNITSNGDLSDGFNIRRSPGYLRQKFFSCPQRLSTRVLPVRFSRGKRDFSEKNCEE